MVQEVKNMTTVSGLFPLHGLFVYNKEKFTLLSQNMTVDNALRCVFCVMKCDMNNIFKKRSYFIV